MSEETNGQGSAYAVTVRKAANLSAEEWSDERIGAIARTVAPPDAKPAEIAMFLAVAHRYQLDPFLKEIWLAKDKGRLILLTGRDSFIKVAERDEGYLGFDSGVVYQNDHFEVDREADSIIVTHQVKGFVDRGARVGAFCVAYHKVRRQVLVLRKWEDYAHLHGKDNWKNYGDDMLETRVITAALRRQYTISGIYSESEFIAGELHSESEQAGTATKERLEALKDRMRNGDEEPEEPTQDAEYEVVDHAEVDTETPVSEIEEPELESERPETETPEPKKSKDELRKEYFGKLRELHPLDEYPDPESWEELRHEWQKTVVGKATIKKWTISDYELALDALAGGISAEIWEVEQETVGADGTLPI